MTRGITRYFQRHGVALLALFVALGGTSFAASQLVGNNSVGSPQVINGSLQTVDLSKKAKKTLKGQRGARGARGAQGAQGARGATGPLGAAGGDLTGTYPNPTIANGAVTAAKLAPTPAFQDLTLENGWVKFFASSPSAYNTPGFTKDALGFVHLRGALGGLAQTSTVFAHLPAGYRPAGGRFNWFPVANTNGDSTPRSVVIDIDNADGAMNVDLSGDYNYAFLSLEGVTFFAGP